MSAVDIVRAAHLSTQQKTSKGNDYNKSNYGKFAGTALGVGMGGHFWYKFNKVKKDPEFFEIVNDTTRNLFEGLSDKFDDFKITPEQLEKEVPKLIKKYVNAGGLLVVSAILALGLGIGAIGDSIANHFIRKNADNKVQADKK